MIFCVDAKPGDVRHMLAEISIDPASVDWDDTSGTTEVTLFPSHDDGKAFVFACRRKGYRVWRGRARGAHADPTYAQAAQHILLRRRTRAA